MAYRLKSEHYDAVQYDGTEAQAVSLLASMIANLSPEFEHLADCNDPLVWTGNLLVMTSTGEFQTVESTDYILTNVVDFTRFRVTEADFIANYEELPS